MPFLEDDFFHSNNKSTYNPSNIDILLLNLEFNYTNLLKKPFEEFWATILYNHSLKINLETFCRFSTKKYQNGYYRVIPQNEITQSSNIINIW
jgi:hypothetical protein